MQSQQSSANNHDCYSRSIRVDHAVTEITPVPSAPCTQISSRINGPSPPAIKGILSSEKKKPSTETWACNLCDPCNLKIIVDPSPHSRSFFRFGCPSKKISLLCCALFTLALQNPIFSHVVRIDCLITRSSTINGCFH